VSCVAAAGHAFTIRRRGEPVVRPTTDDVASRVHAAAGCGATVLQDRERMPAAASRLRGLMLTPLVSRPEQWARRRTRTLDGLLGSVASVPCPRAPATAGPTAISTGAQGVPTPNPNPKRTDMAWRRRGGGGGDTDLSSDSDSPLLYLRFLDRDRRFRPTHSLCLYISRSRMLL
jgi:hypothetical protein